MVFPLRSIKVMLVDDHPLVLEAIRQLLEPRFRIVGTVQESAKIIPVRSNLVQTSFCWMAACRD
jgi:DNA-binding NarL/FixJ family response regulator